MIDRELQDAFQECEEQMASLGAPWSKTVSVVVETTGETIVKESNESSLLLPTVVQPGHSNGAHGNWDTHGNSEATKSQDRLVFSFRDYILGNETSSGEARTESVIKAAEESNTTKDTDQNEQKHSEMQPGVEINETQGVLSEREQPKVDLYAKTGESGSLGCNKGTEVIAVITDMKNDNADNRSSFSECTVESRETDDAVNEDCKIRHLNNSALLGEKCVIQDQENKHSVCLNTQSDSQEKEERKEENTKLQTPPQVDSLAEVNSDLLLETSKEHPIHSENGTQGCNNVEEVSQVIAGNKNDNQEKECSFSECAVESRNTDDAVNEEHQSSHLSDNGAVSEVKVQEQQHNDGVKVNPQSDPQQRQEKEAKIKKKKQQKKRKSEKSQEIDEKAVKNNVSVVNADVCTVSEPKSVSQAVTQSAICDKPPDNGFDFKRFSPRGNTPCSSPHHLTASSPEPISTETVLHEDHQSDDHSRKDTACGFNHDNRNKSKDRKTLVSCDLKAIFDTASLEDVVTLTDSQSHILDGMSTQSCVGASYVDSALEKASAVGAVLPLTTPTMPEVIKSKGKGESTGSIANESEEAVGENGLKEAGKCFAVKKGIQDSGFLATKRQSTNEKGCSGEMPHNSAESEVKAVAVCFADTEISPSEEGDGEKEPLCLEVDINTSPLGLITGADCQYNAAAAAATGLEEEGEKRAGGGEKVREKQRLVDEEHSSFVRPQGSASGVPSAETGECPPIDVAESQLKSQSRTETIATITESICAEQDRLSLPCPKQHGAAISPLPTLTEQSSKIDKHNLNPEELLGSTCESSFSEKETIFLPSTSLQSSLQIPADSTQQVQTESSPKEAGNDSQSNTITSEKSGVDMNTCRSSGRKNRVHFAESVKQEDPVRLGNMALGCASLPPLTVHESLHHPVFEASYIFQDFLGSIKSGIPKEIAVTKGKPGNQSSPESRKAEEGVQSDEGVTSRKDITENKAIVPPSNVTTETGELLPVSETCSEMHPTENHKTGSEEVDTKEAKESVIHKAVEPVSTNAAENDAPVICLLKEKETNELKGSEGLIETSQPHTPCLKSDIIHEKESNEMPVSCFVNVADDMKSFSNVFSGLPVGPDFGTDALPETMPIILQTDPDDPSCPSALPGQVAINLDISHSNESTTQCGALTKDPQPLLANSEDTASAQLSISVTKQGAGNFALQPIGPMLSHLESVNDCDVASNRKTDNCSTDVESNTLAGELEAYQEVEVAQLSVVLDLKHSDGNANDVDLKNANIDNDIETVENTSDEARFTYSQDVSALIPIVKPACAFDTVAIKSVICEVPIDESHIKGSSSISSTGKTNDEIKEDSAEEKDGTSNQTSIMLKEENNQHTPILDSQKEPMNCSKLEMGKVDTVLQRSNEIDKASLEENSDRQLPHKVAADSLIREGTNGSGVLFKSESLSHNVESFKDILSAEFNSEHLTENSESSSGAGQSNVTTVSRWLSPQQQEQPKSRQTAEGFSDGCLERYKDGEEKKQVVGETCQSETRADRRTDNEQVIDVNDKGGAIAVAVVDNISEASYLSNHSKNVDETASSDVGKSGSAGRKVNVGDTRQDICENKRLGLVKSQTTLMSDTDFVQDLGEKAQQNSNLASLCQNQHEAVGNTAATVEAVSQEHEILQVLANSADIQADTVLNQAKEIKGKIVTDLVMQPVRVNEALSKNSTTEECKIQDKKLQSPNRNAAAESCLVAPIKDVEITTEGMGALNEDKGKEQSVEKVSNNEASETQEAASLTVPKQSETIEAGDISESPRMTVCPSEGSLSPLMSAEKDSDLTDEVTSDIMTIPSNFNEDSINQSEKPKDDASYSLPSDFPVSGFENKSFEKAPSCCSVNKENSDVSQNDGAADTMSWIKALREAATQSQPEQESSVEITR